MTFIKTIPPEEAAGRLKMIYECIEMPDRPIDNILTALSLRPATLEAHLILYKNLLHHTDNLTPRWLLEAIGVYISIINNCSYCLEHHFTGLSRLLGDDERAETLKAALTDAAKGGDLKIEFLNEKELKALRFAGLLTFSPDAVDSNVINDLRKEGWSDGEILEINQVAAYFAYANRTVQGLGVTTVGDVLGLSPIVNDNEGDWRHL